MRIIGWTLLFLLCSCSLPSQAAEPGPSKDQVIADLQKQLAEAQTQLQVEAVEKLKLRLSLADEKLVVTRFEWQTLRAERERLCAELQSRDVKTFEQRCKESPK